MVFQVIAAFFSPLTPTTGNTANLLAFEGLDADRQVLVFRNPQKLSQFVMSGSPADASSDPDIKVYRLNEKGVSVQADWGARYFRDPDLN
jgi:hypothetical protein